MARLPERRDEAALVRWVQDAEEPPSWAEVHRRWQEEGRRSRVSQPSEAQRRFEIREPRTGGRMAFKISVARTHDSCVDAVSGAAAHFQRGMMMDVDQAARAMKDAEIEDFPEGFREPT
jgi:hypothetical protein